MSSYHKYFLGIRKYGSSAFKRTINHVSTTSSYLSTLWDTCARKSSKSVIFRRIIYMTLGRKVRLKNGKKSWVFSLMFDISDYWKSIVKSSIIDRQWLDYDRIYQIKPQLFLPKSWRTKHLPTERHMRIWRSIGWSKSKNLLSKSNFFSD